MGALLSMPGCIGNVFWVRSNAWIWDFSPTQHDRVGSTGGIGTPGRKATS